MRFTVESRGARARAVAFGNGGRLPVAEGEPAEATFTLEVNEWNGVSEPRLVLRRARRCELAGRGPAERLRPSARAASSGGLGGDRAAGARRCSSRVPSLSASIRAGRPLPLGMAIAEDPKSPRHRGRAREHADVAATLEQAPPTPMRRVACTRSPEPPGATLAGPERVRAAAAQRPVRDRLRARGGLGGGDRPRARAGRVRVRVRAPRGAAAQVRRGLHRAPGRRGAHLRGHAAGHRDAVRGAAARHRRGHLGLDRGGARALRRGDRRDRRRRHEADRASPSSRATRRRRRTTAR